LVFLSRKSLKFNALHTPKYLIFRAFFCFFYFFLDEKVTTSEAISGAPIKSNQYAPKKSRLSKNG